MAKYIPHTGYQTAVLTCAETEAQKVYREVLIAAKQSGNFDEYDFNRGFEFGVQWILDHPIYIDRLR